MHDCLRAITERWDEPFTQPIVFDKETHELKSEDWAVKVFNLTGSGRFDDEETAVEFWNEREGEG